MKQLIKPQKLNPGDKIATVSLSWGGAGDDEIKWRYLPGLIVTAMRLQYSRVEQYDDQFKGRDNRKDFIPVR